ncbi:Bacterial SH3 domain protein [Roseovarius albus]|uniref:Bacterial SH3 domain protein n=1 Tax=Roseovarius albus TaxID=1247867 RepID=A0A1X6ZI30_9RHOB|nr:SH3 domain-containing protein [Roseovarius albus]SLN52323.1 Bacterial SH3 domain protein [Roseovarius albus]
MWRFILVSFAFLGWLFYELSGGANYEPRTQSIQAREKFADVRPVRRPVQVKIVRVSAQDDVEHEPVTRSLTSLASLAINEGDRFEITLASASGGSDLVAQQAAVAGVEIVQVPTVAVDLSKISTVAEPVTEEPVIEDLADVRKVTGSVVNMRSGPGTRYNRIGNLTKGSEVTVLRSHDNGWVKLRAHDTGRVGWMSARLLTTASN